MGWKQGLILAVAVAVPAGVAGAWLQRAQLRKIAEEERLLAEARRRVEELAPVRAQIDEFQKKKADYERRIQEIEKLRSAPSPRHLMKVAERAQSLGLTVEEMSLSGDKLVLRGRGPAPTVATLARDLEKGGYVAKVSVQTTGKDAFSLEGVLLPAAEPRP